MVKKGATPPAGGEFLDKIGGLFEQTDPGLDRTRDYLEELRQSGQLKKTAASIHDEYLEKMREDLAEVGVHGKEQEKYIQEIESHWKKASLNLEANAILHSPERANIDAFINLENLPLLKAVVESAEPEAKWKSLIKRLASRYLGLDPEKVDQYFGPVLAALGLGSLTEKKEDKPPKAEKETAEKKAPEEEGKEEKETEEKEKEPEDEQEAEAVAESQEVLKKPGSTLFLGDSINEVFAQKESKEHLEIEGNIGTLAKGSETTAWLINAIDSKPESFFEGFENAVVLIGTNDLGSEKSGEEIWENIKKIYVALKAKKPGIKIHAVTLPPGKGNKAGQWGSDFEGVERKRQYINAEIAKAKEAGLVDQVIDLAAKKSEGGLADDHSPETLAEDYRRFGPTDYIHPKANVLAGIYNQALKKSA